MEKIVVLEIMDKFGKVKERFKIGSLPIAIGRAYSNDVILDDPYVSPHHLRLDCDPEGNLTLTDMESTNGLYRLSPSERVPQIRLQHETKVRAGHTVLRFRFLDHPVQEARIDRFAPHRLNLYLSSPWGLMALLFMTTAVLLTSGYLETYERFSFLRLFIETAMLLILLLGWSGGWALASKITTHHSHYPVHGVIACMGLIGFILSDAASDYLAFNLSSHTAAYILDLVSGTLIIWGVLYGHLRYCTQASPKRLGLISGGVCTSIIGILVLSIYVFQSEFNSTLDFPEQIKPPSFKFAHDQTMDQFFTEVNALKQKLDNLVQEKE